jgi:hypothetical protein
VRQLTGAPAWARFARLAVGSLAAAGLSGLGMIAVEAQFGSSRWSAIAAIAVGGVVGAIIFVVAVTVLAGVRPSMLLRRRVAGA